MYKIVCQYRECHKVFYAVVPWAKFCSDAHRQAEYRARLADKESKGEDKSEPSPTSDLEPSY